MDCFWSGRGRRALAVAAACTLAGLLGAASAGAETLVFKPGPEQTFVVPSGVTHIKVTAIGEKGQDLCLFGSCFTGFSEKVSATLAVTPGETLYTDFVGAGAGPGRGGNAADLRTVPHTEAGSLSSRLIVAGAGGGEGEEEEGNFAGQGGNAGAAEGVAGNPDSSSAGTAFGGGGGSQTKGGAGGTPAGGTAGEAGSFGQGGKGGTGSPAGNAGGGGGGYYGGGGGGAGNFAGAGGGGGSSFIASGAEETSFVLNTLEEPTGVTITYAGGTETVPFPSSGNEQSFVVPVGVSRIKVVAVGENGQDRCCGGSRGATVTAALSVKHGQTYFIDFGGGGSSNIANGGNAADVRSVSRSQAGSLESRLVVAGGGGGDGISEENSIGGAGGNAGFAEGGAGGNGFWQGGGGGTQKNGGAGGKGEAAASNGEAGKPGQGGKGGPNSEGDGGGGGGGYFGGGGGGGGCCGSAGGGGGSSFAVAGAEEVSATLNGSPKEQPKVSIVYKSASPPSVSITTPAEGAGYSQGQSVAASYSCEEGAGGPGLETCSGTAAKGAAIDTTTPGKHEFTVIATSQDGLSTSRTVSYTVASAPTVSIVTPAEGASYGQGQTVDAAYSCSEGEGGPGLKPGSEGCSGPVGKGAPIETSTSGKHEFTVVATSQDGLSTSKTVSYTVTAPPPPSVEITTPAEGASYEEGQVVDAAYSCKEGEGGPGLKAGSEGCSGPVEEGAPIDTSTAGVHEFAVTAHSQDGQSASATVKYTVTAAPTAPDFGRCLRAPKGAGGAFANASCTVAAAGNTGHWEWLAGPGPKPGFSLAHKGSSPIALETTSGKALICTGVAGSGSITGLKTAALVLMLTGCEDGGEECTSTGTAGQVRLALTGSLAWSDKARRKLDLRLVPDATPHYQCVGAQSTSATLETNGILLPVRADRKVARVTDYFTERKGKQVPSSLEGEPPLLSEEVRLEGGTEERTGAGLRATLVQSFEEGYEINSAF